MKKFNYKSRKGFTLIELLVVIGILAVLAAIAIPSVAGLIDRANVSADKTNSNEMTNALERFASEYELYCQDIASGTLDPNNLDSAQGRVKNVVGVTTRAGIEDLEIGQGETVADNAIAIYRDTKYPVNAETMKKVVENYTKTSSSTFEPKQSDMHYWYSPDCGVVVFAEPNADQDKENKLNNQIQSGMDAKGNDLGPTTQWIDLTLGAALSGNAGGNTPPVTPEPPIQNCQHSKTKKEGTITSTCTTDGHTGRTICLDCTAVISNGSVVTATGHTTESGTCDNCGETVKKLITATLTYDMDSEDNQLYKPSDAPLTITITAEEGMTWGEWCESEYNTFGFYNDKIVQEFQTVMDGNGNRYPTGTVIGDGNGNIESRSSILGNCFEICDGKSAREAVKANETIISGFAYWLYWD